MNKSECIALLREALVQLGIKKSSKIRFSFNSQFQIGNVYIDDEYYGVFDFEKKTFVD